MQIFGFGSIWVIEFFGIIDLVCFSVRYLYGSGEFQFFHVFVFSTRRSFEESIMGCFGIWYPFWRWMFYVWVVSWCICLATHNTKTRNSTLFLLQNNINYICLQINFNHLMYVPCTFILRYTQQQTKCFDPKSQRLPTVMNRWFRTACAVGRFRKSGFSIA